MTKKDCQNKVQDSILTEKEDLLFFCILFRIYLYQCPEHCPYFLEGNPISMKVIYTNDYEMECPYFQYIGKNPAIKSDSGFFYCTYTGTNPICNNCPFAQEKAVKHKLNQESS